MFLLAAFVPITVACGGAKVFLEGKEQASVPVHLGKHLEISGIAFDQPLPNYLEDTQYHAVAAQGTLDNAFFNFVCPSGCGKCSFYVAVHDCAPCSLHYNGGLPAIAAVDVAWEHRTCGPSFSKHPTSVYRTVVQPGQSQELPLIRSVKYIGVFSAESHSPEWCDPPQRDFGPKKIHECTLLPCPYP